MRDLRQLFKKSREKCNALWNDKFHGRCLRTVILLVLSLFLTLVVLIVDAQSRDSYTFAVPSPNKDTLYVTNTEMGELVHRIWVEDTTLGSNTIPVVRYVDRIKSYKIRYEVSLVDLSESY